MKLQTIVGGQEHSVSLSLNEGLTAVEIDDRSYQVEVRETSAGVYLLIDGTEVYRSRVEPSPGPPNSFSVALRGEDYDVQIIDPKRLRGSQISGAHDHGSAEIMSPMPGKVVRVLVAVGANVEAGAGILVVEAMKMQNELKSPKAGVVVSINAQTGATVSAGEVLAVVE